jgi:hypothetical protein
MRPEQMATHQPLHHIASIKVDAMKNGKTGKFRSTSKLLLTPMPPGPEDYPELEKISPKIFQSYYELLNEKILLVFAEYQIPNPETLNPRQRLSAWRKLAIELAKEKYPGLRSKPKVGAPSQLNTAQAKVARQELMKLIDKLRENRSSNTPRKSVETTCSSIMKTARNKLHPFYSGYKNLRPRTLKDHYFLAKKEQSDEKEMLAYLDKLYRWEASGMVTPFPEWRLADGK